MAVEQTDKEPSSKENGSISGVKEPTVDKVASTLVPSKAEQLRLLWKNVYRYAYEFNLPKVSVPNPKLSLFRDPSANDVGNYISTWIEVWNKDVKWVLYMNSCFCSTLYLIKKLKERHPDLAENIKLNIEILTYNNKLTAHAFIEVENGTWKPLVIDFARDDDIYIKRWKYKNWSKGAVHHCTITIPSNKFEDGDNIYKIADKNKAEIAKYTLPNDITLTPEVISLMLDNRLNQWEKDNDWEGTDNSPNYLKWKKTNENPVFCFEDVDENGEVKELQFKVEGNKESKGKKVSIKIWQNKILYMWSIIDSRIWAELKINNDKIYAKYPDWDRPISFSNKEIYKFLTSMAA